MSLSSADRNSASGLPTTSRQNPVRKFATYGRADLRYFLSGAKPIQPRHQRRLQARWDSRRRSGNCPDGAFPGLFAFCLKDGFRHFFDE